MGLLRNNNARLLAFLFSLGLVAGAVQGCDKGLADKLETKKDDRFDQGSKRLSITASQRYNASMAAKMVFEMAQTIVEPRATRARRVGSCRRATGRCRSAATWEVERFLKFFCFNSRVA